MDVFPDVKNADLSSEESIYTTDSEDEVYKLISIANRSQHSTEMFFLCFLFALLATIDPFFRPTLQLRQEVMARHQSQWGW